VAADQRNLNAIVSIIEITAEVANDRRESVRKQNGSCRSHENLQLSKKLPRWMTKQFSLEMKE
jgi:hypothetical protein